MRTFAMSPAAESVPEGLREQLIKMGAKVVIHGRYAIFQMAEGAVPRQMFILRFIGRLRAPLASA